MTVATDTEAARMRGFWELSPRQQIAAIRRLDDQGYTVHSISHATGVAVEQIALVLADPLRRSPPVGLPAPLCEVRECC